MTSVSTAPSSITLQHVTKIFDNGVLAVDDLTLEIAEGEFFSLLGPSGCGKTTTLRMIAGFEEPTRGRLSLRGRDVTETPPHRRDIGMVFQNYALFPHRTVFENVAFGLRMRKVSREEIRRRVADALRLVALTGLEERRPAQLSGGQQQRVALARAIVIEPAVLLCDEPLGALDKQLRKQMQFELKELQRTIGVTLVYVTHDQEEALAMSDRIAVMSQGRVAQLGAPLDIYNQPQTRFVSEFIGDINLFDGTLVAGDQVETSEGDRLRVTGSGAAVGGRVAVALRPEKVRILDNGTAPDNAIRARIDGVNFLGGSILYQLRLGSGRPVLAMQPNEASLPPRELGAEVTIGWNAADAIVLRD